MLKRRMPKPHTVRGSALAIQFQAKKERIFEIGLGRRCVLYLYLWLTIHSGGAYTLVPSYLNSSSSTKKPPEPKSMRRILLVSRSTTRFSSFTSLWTIPRSWQAVTMSNTYKYTGQISKYGAEEPVWKSFWPAPRPTWWQLSQSQTSQSPSWAAPSQRWNSLVFQRSQVSWQHQAPFKKKKGVKHSNKSGNLLNPKHENELEWNFSFSQAAPGDHFAGMNLSLSLISQQQQRRKITLEQPALLPLVSGRKVCSQQTPGL